MKTMRIISLLSLLPSLHMALAALSNEGLGIPGTTQTDTGYDTELGVDSVCWKSHNYLEDPTVGSHTYFPNPLIPSFQLGGRVELLTSCPKHLNVSVLAPVEFTEMKDVVGWRPRTLTEYNFTVSGTIDLGELGASSLVSDFGATIYVQIVLCKLGSSGFCSPFVHEQSNARNAAMGVTTPPKRGDLHGGTHVHSSKLFVKLEPGMTSYEFETKVPFIVNEAAEFFAIGAAQFFVGDVEGEPLYRFDVANKADLDIIAFVAPATILTVRQPTRLAIYTMIGVGCSSILFLIVMTFYHRSHKIMQLSQASSLLALLVASLLACGCSWMLIPDISDAACKINSFFIYVPLNVVYATLLARLWRAKTILSPLLQGFYGSEVTSGFGRFINRLAYCAKKPKASAVRSSTVSTFQMATVITFLTMPQVITQLLAIILQPRSIITVYNDDDSVGHMECSSGVNRWVSLEIWGFYIIIFMNVLLIILAESNQRLPSLFDEVKVISSIAFVTAIGLFFGTSVVALASGAEDNPEILLVVMTVSIMVISLICSFRLVWPKLLMIWRRETVVVSKLVSDHTGNAEAMSRSSFRRRPVGIYSEMSHVEAGDLERLPDFTTLKDSRGHTPVVRKKALEPTEIMISDESTPSRTLVVPMLELQERLITVNGKVTSGMRVDREEWQELRVLMQGLGSKFLHDVAFEWENNELHADQNLYNSTSA